MVLKRCEFCSKEIETDNNSLRFCGVLCQRKHYNRRPGIREKGRIRMQKYRQTHPEWKEKHRILAVTRYREKRAEYWKKYGKRPEFREKVRQKEKLRRETEPRFAIEDRLRRSLHHAFAKYSTTGKVMSSKKYGIDWKNIIDGLKPFPKDLKSYEIDHIIPLHTFDLTDPAQVKKAFDSSNLQWLTISENRRKSGKTINKEVFINSKNLRGMS